MDYCSRLMISYLCFMKTINLLFTLMLSGMIFSTSTNAQEIDGTEFGVDGYFGASTNGGSFTLGAKYGFKFGEYLIAGPSLRYQRSWTKNVTTGAQGGYNVFGGGVFGHARFFNALFVGAEFEMMRTPFIIQTTAGQTKNWIPTLFIGGGYSQEFNGKFRINAGIMYDIINNLSSPFRQGYFLRNSQNVLLPVIYRIAFFFPLS